QNKAAQVFFPENNTGGDTHSARVRRIPSGLRRICSESRDLLRIRQQAGMMRVNPSALIPGLLGSARGWDDGIHAQVFHKLTVVIKAMSDRIHRERKTRL